MLPPPMARAAAWQIWQSFIGGPHTASVMWAQLATQARSIHDSSLFAIQLL